MESYEKTYLKRKEIADILGVTKATLHNWRNKNLMPKPDVKIGNIVRWETSTIDSWLESRNRHVA
jgi:predicted DNA-binding transcriptional regulator AlpA